MLWPAHSPMPPPPLAPGGPSPGWGGPLSRMGESPLQDGGVPGGRQQPARVWPKSSPYRPSPGPRAASAPLPASWTARALLHGQRSGVHTSSPPTVGFTPGRVSIQAGSCKLPPREKPASPPCSRLLWDTHEAYTSHLTGTVHGQDHCTWEWKNQSPDPETSSTVCVNRQSLHSPI